MNCALEDCVIFSKMLETHKDRDMNSDEWTNVLEEFARTRKPNTDAIQDLAVQNFLEMRFKVYNFFDFQVNDPFY